MEMVTIPAYILGKMVLLLMILSFYFLIMFIITTVNRIKMWPYRKAIRKFKKICRRKRISAIVQECIIIKNYSEEYEIIDNKIIYTGKKKTTSNKNTIDEIPLEPPKEKEPKWYPNGWYYDEKIKKWVPPDYVEPSTMENGSLVYNEKVRMWVNKDQCDPEENQRKYEENRKRWADYEKREASREETRKKMEAIIEESEKNNDSPINKANAEKRIEELYFGQYDRYSDLTDEELKFALQMHVNRDQPTYEEWKATRNQEKTKQPKPERKQEPEKKTQKVKPRKAHPEN